MDAIHQAEQSRRACHFPRLIEVLFTPMPGRTDLKVTLDGGTLGFVRLDSNTKHWVARSLGDDRVAATVRGGFITQQSAAAWLRVRG
jgi:hypothetical protein